MKQALFGTFLVVFGATALVTLLGIAGPLSIREEYLNKLFYLLIVEVIASVVALFKKTDFFGNQPALPPNKNFIVSASVSQGTGGALERILTA
jgi:hypothetical protein